MSAQKFFIPSLFLRERERDILLEVTRTIWRRRRNGCTWTTQGRRRRRRRKVYSKLTQ